MKLYIVPGSPNCRKVQAVVHELALESAVEFALVDFAAGEHKAAPYLELNPNGLVPTLVDGGFRLWESNAIARFLAETADDTRLYPGDPRRRAVISMWQSWELAHFGRHLGVALYERLFKPLMGGSPDHRRAAAALAEWRPFAAILDKHLDGRPFIAGDAVTVADFCLACQLPVTELAGIDLSAYPAIQKWLARLDERPAWQASRMPEPMLAAIKDASAAHRQAAFRAPPASEVHSTRP